MAGHDNLYRLRLDGWRLVYTAEEERLIILILEIAPKQQPERYQVDDELIRQIQRYQVDNELPRQIQGEKIRLLVVDNISASRETLQKLISAEHDMEVVGTATDGAEAIWMTIDLKPDVVLMEITLPNMDGFTACEMILQQLPTTQIILMSAYSEPDYPHRSKLAGAREFLVKAITPRELLSAIRRLHIQPDEAAWYIVYTYPGYESQVKQNLLYRAESLGMADKILRVIVPGEAEAEPEMTDPIPGPP